MHTIYIDGKKGYLIYDKEAGKKNSYVGYDNLVKKQYVILYQILDKYELLSYFKDE